jgi:protein-S-isoprenylcysteine O-methyltransferase Ste14
MQLTFMRQEGWIALPKAAIKRVIFGIWIYVILILVTLGISLYLFIFPSRWAELTFGVVALVLSIFALYWQHLGMQEEKKRMHIA